MLFIEQEPAAPVDASPSAAFAQALWRNLRSDAPLYGLIGLYIVFALAVGRLFHMGGVESLGLYLRPWFGSAVILTAMFVGPRAALAAIVALRDPARAKRLIPTTLLADVGAGLLLFFGLCLFLGAFTLAKVCLPQIRPFYFDPALSAADRAFHLGHDPWRLLEPVLVRLPLSALQGWYYLGWPLITGLCPFIMAISRTDRALRFQFLLAFLLAWIVGGTVVACVFMSGGPVFYGRITGDVHRYGVLNHYLWAHVQPVSDRLWQVYQRRELVIGAGISAFPSMHMMMITLATLLARRARPLLGWAVGLFAVLIAATSVALGWHYALGDYIAVAGAVGLWRAAGLAAHPWRRRAAAAPLPFPLPDPASPLPDPAA